MIIHGFPLVFLAVFSLNNPAFLAPARSWWMRRNSWRIWWILIRTISPTRPTDPQRGSGRQKWGYTVPGSRYDVNMCTGNIYVYNYVYYIIFIFIFVYIHIYLYIYTYNVKLYVNYTNTMCIYSYTPHTLPAPSRATCGGHPDYQALYRAWRFRSRGHQEGPRPVVGITEWCPHDMVIWWKWW